MTPSAACSPRAAGTPQAMDENRSTQESARRDPTAPPAPTHEASAPPGNPEPDERAVREAEDKLEQAGGGR